MAIDTGGRPLSPHLQVYRPQLTSVLSITHRATGVALSLGTVGLVCWLMAIAGGAAQFEQVQGFYRSLIGKLLLFGWSYALFYHLCNGIRHLLWDAGKNLEIESVNKGGVVMLISSAVLTVAAWAAALM